MSLFTINQNQTLPVIAAGEIVFIDKGVEDYQSLVKGVKPGIAVVLLDSQRDGIEQITKVLAQNSYTKIHIVSHGSPGCLYLGNSQLNLDNLNSYAQQLKNWFTCNQEAEPQVMGSQPETGNQNTPETGNQRNLSPSPCPLVSLSPTPPSLLLYGCNVAAGDAGEEFIEKLHYLTAANIAASTTAIGNAQKGGNWQLDLHKGEFLFLSQLAFSEEATVNYAGVLATTIYVKSDPGGSNNGSSWVNAYTDLQAAIAAANSGDQIWVAQGTYKPTNTTDRDISFELNDGVAIYGGFNGTETNLNQRDWQNNETILSGDIGNQGRNFDNTITVVKSVGNSSQRISNTAILDGFTVRDGNGSSGGGLYLNNSDATLNNLNINNNIATNGAGLYSIDSNSTLNNLNVSNNSANLNSAEYSEYLSNNPEYGIGQFFESFNIYLIDYKYWNGAGLYFISSDVTLNNLSVSNNISFKSGAGLYVESSDITLDNSSVSDNTSENGGAGLHVESSDVTLNNLSVSNNDSFSFGAGLYVESSDATLNNLSVSNNTAFVDGAGLFLSSSDATLNNSIISNNTANSGGGIRNFYSNPTLNNVTISGNYAPNGGGIANDSDSTPQIRNSIIWDNTATHNPQTNETDGGNNFQNSIVKGSNDNGSWNSALGTNGGGNLDVNPEFVDAAKGDFRLKLNSPAIDTGNNSLVPADTSDLDGDGDRDEPIPFDLDGNARTLNATVDIGAYEKLVFAVDEDAAAPTAAVGNLVSDLFEIGIAITAADTTNGSWFYSIDNGSNWNPLGTVSDNNAPLLAADTNTRIYFQPNANYNGTINDGITFRAWDTTTGSNGGIADTTINGGSTAFSSDTQTAPVIVNSINDAPSFAGDATLSAVDEGVANPAGETIANLFNDKFQDVDTGASLSGVAVVGNSVTNEGKWQYSTDGSTWNDIAATVNDANAFALSESTKIRFLPGGNFNGTPPLLTVRALDDSYSGGFATTIDVTTNGGDSAISASTNTISTTVNPVVETIYVDSSATGDNNGNSWNDAYTDLQSALAAANSGDQIWVAQGTYKPTDTTDRDISFELKDNVAIYGSFAGGETNLNQRDFQNNITILSGDNTSYNVVKFSNDSGTTTLDGFTIQEGNSNDDGGGIWNKGNLTLRNSVVKNNLAADDGGGIRNDGNLTIINSAVANNFSIGTSQTSGGGGLINTTAATVNIINSTFSGNTALNGGGIRNDGNLNLINSTLSSNTAQASGGGLVNTVDINQTFTIVRATATIKNSTITKNTAGSELASGVANVGNLTVSNSIIAGNTNNDDIRNQFSVNPLSGISNSGGNNLIGNGEGTSFTNGANGDIVGDSTNPIDAKLNTLQDNGGLTQTHALLNGSPAVNAGSNSNIAPDTFDIDGNSNTTETLPFEQRGLGFERIIDSTVDIGAYEIVSVVEVSATTADGIYKTGDTVDITVKFAKPVSVNTTNGLPQLTLETGDTDRVAIYESGNGSDTLTFTYTVQSGDESLDLDYIFNTALQLNGGTIKDSNGNEVDLTLPKKGETDSLSDNKDIVIDAIAPTVSLNSTAPQTVNGKFSVTATFTESVTNFDSSDITLTNATINNFSGSDANYSFDITPQATGSVTVDINADVATDIAGNNNTAATQLTREADFIVPTVTLTSTAPQTVNGKFTVTATFTESVTNFDETDVTLTNATVDNFSGSDASYSFDVTPTATGRVTVDISADVATDIPGNNNTAATQLTREADLTIPTVTGISALTPTISDSTKTFTLTVEYSEEMDTGVNPTISLNPNKTITFDSGSWDSDNKTYVATYSVTDENEEISNIDVKVENALDKVGNIQTAFTSNDLFSIDNKNPEVTLTSTAPQTVNGKFSVTATFTESVTNFDINDITLTNATVDNFSGSDASYSFDVTPQATGRVTVDINADVAQDNATNNNTAATQLTREADFIVPTVTLTSTAPQTVNGKFTVTATFTESVTNFDETDITLTNATVDNFSGSDASYSFDVTPQATGSVTVDINADVATDIAGNDNTAATQLTTKADLTNPTVSNIIASTPTISDSTTTFTLTVEYSEEMNRDVNPNITFPAENPNNTITLTGGSWNSDSKTYVATYSVTDAEEEIADIDVKVENAQDKLGNIQQPFTLPDVFSVEKPNIAPVVDDATFSIQENSAENTVVGIVTASDSDNEALQFALAAGNLDLDKDGNLAFAINPDTGEITVNDKDDIDFENTPQFNLEVTATDTSGLSDSADITINLIDVAPAKFDVNASQNGIFSLDGGDKTNIKFTLTNIDASVVNEIAVFEVDENGNIDGNAPGSNGFIKAALSQSQVIFSAISNLPNGFTAENIQRVLEINSDARLEFLSISNGTIDTALAEIESTGNTNLSIDFSTSDNLALNNLNAEGFTLELESNIQVNAALTQENPVKATQLQTQKELIDLRDITGSVAVSVEVYREAAFDNLIGFYKVTDVNGGIDIDGDGIADINPNDAGYKNAALTSRITSLDLLSTENQQTATFNETLDGGSILATFIITDGTFDEAINNNAEVYFSFLGANSDKTDHIRLLSDNTFGFEDMVNGGDKDFNDSIIKINLSNG